MVKISNGLVMIDSKKIKNYIITEYVNEKRRSHVNEKLSDTGKSEEGLIIENMKYITSENNHSIFSFAINNSKFKQGDFATLKWIGASQDVIVKDVFQNQVFLTTRKNSSIYFSASEEGFSLEPSEFDLPLSIANKSDFLNSNRFISILNKEVEPNSKMTQHGQKYLTQVYNDFVVSLENNPDPSQRTAIIRSLLQPDILSIQGPPGTGKTRVLAITACLFSRLGFEVIVLSNSHSAVNNALNEINKLDDSSYIIKLGQQIKNIGLSHEIYQFESFSAYNNQAISLTENNIIGLTLYNAILNLTSYSPPDPNRVILLDEASQVPLSLGVFLGAFKSSCIILYGDSQQMPPIFDEGLINHEYSISIFDFLQYNHPDHFISLRKTYRLNNSLTRVVGDSFYINPLTDKTFLTSGNANGKLSFKIATDNKTIYDILDSKYSFVWIKSPSNFSRQVNRVEAEFISEIIKICYENNINSKDYVVVTPYRRQINEILNRTKVKLSDVVELPIIDTVEKVQGQSVEMVIVSYVTSDPDYLEDVSRFIFSPNRLNVTISRAKSKVIFFCSEVVLSTIPSRYEDLGTQKLLKELKSKSDLLIELEA